VAVGRMVLFLGGCWWGFKLYWGKVQYRVGFWERKYSEGKNEDGCLSRGDTVMQISISWGRPGQKNHLRGQTRERGLTEMYTSS